ncbi:MAG: hypothetical protein JWM78_24 [Verrucomicrobiaceae bacterium]|nr:hypothetical protein [Verrucomicrobiaceae bacterium]
MDRARRVIIIAGPAGAGKTIFARELLTPDAACPNFVNADLIAAGLAPFAPASAAAPAYQVMQQELQRLFVAGESFAFETTLAEPEYLSSIEQWQTAGYRVTLIFLQLASAELAIARTAQRAVVSDITVDAAAIRRDWLAGFENFEQVYAPAVDDWALYDNSDIRPMLLDWREDGAARGSIETASNQDLRLSFDALRRAAQQVHEIAELTGTPVIVSRNGVLAQLSSGLEEATVSIHEARAPYGK